MEKLSGKSQLGGGMRVLFAFACVVIVVAGLRASATLFVPVILGVFFALLSLPILNWLDARGLPRLLAVIATVMFDLLILGVIAFLLSGIIGDLQSKSADYAERLRKQAAEFSETMDSQLERLQGFWTRAGVAANEKPESIPDADVTPPISVPTRDFPMLETDFPTFRELFERYWDSSRIVALVAQFDVVARFTSFASQSVFALVVMIFLLIESHLFTQKVRDVKAARGPDLSRFARTAQDIQKYLAIKTVASSVTGLLAGLACYFFRVDFPLLWGIVAFLFNYVPAIGSIVAAIPPVVLALILHGFWPAAGVLACYLIINFAIGNFLEPIFMGERFGLSTVMVILSVLFWGYIWGPVGMLLAVPLTMIVKVMLDNSPDFRWISALIGKGHPESVELEIPPPHLSPPAESGPVVEKAAPVS